jgi:hypothetical protein
MEPMMNPMEQMREAIRAEIAKANPLEGARTSLELIAESSVRPIREGGQTRFEVVDETGQPRMVERNGAQAPFTIADLVQELRGRHPTLFQAGAPAMPAEANPAPAPAMTAPSQRPLVSDPAMAAPSQQPLVSDAAPPPPAAPAARDWLALGPQEASASLETPARSGEPAVSTAGAALAAMGSKLSEGGSPLASMRAKLPSDAPARFGGAWRQTLARLGGAGTGLLSSVSDMRERMRSRSAAKHNPTVGDLDSRRMRWIPGLGLAVAAVALLGLGSLIYSVIWGSSDGYQAPAAAAAQSDATTTGSIAGPRVPGGPPGSLTGVPEIIDTATLSLQGKLVKLYGVEWTRGAGEPEDLARYLRGRQVTCEAVKPGSDQHRCQVEGQDLSKVVLYNGGGRATSDATPDLVAAEAHARSTRTGLWGRQQKP